MPGEVDGFAVLLFAEQERLLTVFEGYDGGGLFERRPWRREGLGHGVVGILEGGAVFERAAVNVSDVSGKQVPEAITATRPQLAGQPFRATGISLVMHPLNPYAPSFHANFRYFEAGDDWWFGGGLDLTPMYGFTEDGRHFHRSLHDWCANHPLADYKSWKASCDEYFRIPHRQEMRGLGGIFFDRLTDDFTACRQLVADGIKTVLPAYRPILDRRRHLPYGDRERAWQLHRRGRYVEFNLTYDRGTRFGLQTKGNIEAILISLPPMAAWSYDFTPEPGSPEEATLALLQPRDWLSIQT
ncbi:oxygen-dependent coproporphyrinogen oxidase [Kribbella sp. CA-294648]|uniref:oxygen-dependent coproporphyrinogen oxidase n=1 Tax=Kribbella sp. CA-294648 TaxID=3239948 RepID=UPI003D8C5A0A